MNKLFQHTVPFTFGLAFLLAGLASVSVSKAVAAQTAKTAAANKDIEKESSDLLVGNALAATFILLGAIILFVAAIATAVESRKPPARFQM